jgi:hypothetical protein
VPRRRANYWLAGYRVSREVEEAHRIGATMPADYDTLDRQAVPWILRWDRTCRLRERRALIAALGPQCSSSTEILAAYAAKYGEKIT